MAMDDVLWRYVLEFILREPLSDDLLYGAITAASSHRDDPRLLKTLLLRALRCAARVTDSISETVLENLEILEGMDRKDGTEIFDSMKVAYCAVAVWCTVKHLGGGADGECFRAFRSIWKGKVVKLQGTSDLFTEELRNWGNEINGAMLDEDKWRGLVEKKQRVGEVMLLAVNRYVEEAWAVMGPPFLKSIANELVAMEVSREDTNQLVNYSGESVENSVGGVGLAAETTGENVGEMLKMLRSEYDASMFSLETRTSVTESISDALPTPMRKHNDSIDYDLERTPMSKRRTVRRWTITEEEALRSGVRTHGRGNWKTILTHNPEIFEGRTEVDLKDKWRNLTR